MNGVGHIIANGVAFLKDNCIVFCCQSQIIGLEFFESLTDCFAQEMLSLTTKSFSQQRVGIF
jgi:hypothetical protein